MISKKIIKRSLVGVGSALTLTLGIAFAVNAMDKKENLSKSEEKVFAPTWYVYTGPPMSSTDPLNPYDPKDADNYSPYTGTIPNPDCNGDQQVCGVKLNPGQPGHPDQTELDGISDEIDSKTPIANQLTFRPAQ